MPELLHPGSVPCPSVLPLFATGKEASPEIRRSLRVLGSLKFGGYRITTVVGREPDGFEWESFSPTRPLFGDREPCLKGRLGFSLQLREYWGPVESVRTVSPYKLPRTAGRLLAIECFAKDRRNVHIRLLMDNVTALTFINKIGGTKSWVLSSLSRDRWEWCLQRQILVSLTHIRGILNVDADRESQFHLDTSDWKLCLLVFQALLGRWRPLDLDPFVSRLTNQLPRFVSGKPDPLSKEVDAFSLQWNAIRGYAFHPFCLLGRWLSQVIRQEVPYLVLVVPVWKPQPWYLLLLDLLLDLPILLPQSPDLLSREGEQTSNPPPVGRMAYLRG